jgi:hypothetical protein
MSLDLASMNSPLFILKRKTIVKSSNLQQLLIAHGREQHPGKAVTWSNLIESNIRIESDRRRSVEEVEREVKSDMESMGGKMKAGSKVIGSKMKELDRDLETEDQKKKGEEKTGGKEDTCFFAEPAEGISLQLCYGLEVHS